MRLSTLQCSNDTKIIQIEPVRKPKPSLFCLETMSIYVNLCQYVCSPDNKRVKIRLSRLHSYLYLIRKHSTNIWTFLSGMSKSSHIWNLLSGKFKSSLGEVRFKKNSLRHFHIFQYFLKLFSFQSLTSEMRKKILTSKSHFQSKKKYYQFKFIFCIKFFWIFYSIPKIEVRFWKIFLISFQWLFSDFSFKSHLAERWLRHHLPRVTS